MRMDVESYLSQFHGDVRERLDTVRKLIKTEAPDAVESFTYGLVGYKRNGKPYVYFGGFDKHVGFYATPNGHAAFQNEFAPYKQGKGSVQFPHDQALPVELIRHVLHYRIEQTEL